MVRALLVALVLLGAILGSATSAQAAEWCDTDPLLIIRTPDGELVTVYLLVGAWGVVHLPAAQAASLLTASEPVEATSGGHALRVTVNVTVPNDLFGSGFPTRAAVSSGPMGTGTIYATAEGTSGSSMRLRFTLPIP